ncbi:PREDICTED: tetratricopeptide repeat protein 38-like [Priapulus caudatus]|uniref:Tetratricopeptide repeat protein 38 n=1 Tax=Priapulus caudatus TaxID=37621 RepID=A0ABM1ETG7_PRICU|nr:PREDICTED: tetratricopeptide repeat protein 38-like [Priapulus caudatus]
MYAFGLCETNDYSQAEMYARKGLELIPKDGWATHALAHVYEMQGRSQEGISFLSRTLDNWTACSYLSCHNFWHWALYHIERGEYTAALDLYDGVDVGHDRWEAVCEHCRPHVDDHTLVFNDCHYLVAFLGAKRRDYAAKLIESVKKFADEYAHRGQSQIKVYTEVGAAIMAALVAYNDGRYSDAVETLHPLRYDVLNIGGSDAQASFYTEVGAAIMAALVAYNDGRYSDAVETLHPLRYDVLNIGGSDAQRDLFNLFLIHAAQKSNLRQHHNLARSLLMERNALKQESPMLDRLLENMMDHHVK